MLAVPETGPGLSRPLTFRCDHLELCISVKVLINVGSIVLLRNNIIFDVVYAKILVLLDVIDELHFVW